MFKTVDYAELSGRPDLEAKARHATDVLGGVIHDWKDEVVVTWRPTAPGSAFVLELTLALALPDPSGSAAGQIRQTSFEPAETLSLRLDLRAVWLDLLGELSRRQMKRLDEMLLEPAGA